MDYKIYGDIIQEGTPSPENPIEVQGVGNPIYDTLRDSEDNIVYDTEGKEIKTSDATGYEIPVVSKGKNLLNIIKNGSDTTGSGKVTIEINNTNITINGTTDSPGASDAWSIYGVVKRTENYAEYSSIESDVSFVIKPGRYFFNYDGDMRIVLIVGNIGQAVYGSFGGALRFGKGASFTIDKELYCMPLATNTDKKDYYSASNIQLELGSTATEYEPYYEPITTNILLSEPLRKILDYSDTIDLKQSILKKQIEEIELDGSEDEIYGVVKVNMTKMYRYVIYTLPPHLLSNINNVDIYCNIFPVSDSYEGNNINYITTRTGYGNSRLYFFVPFSMLGNIPTENTAGIITAFKQLLSNNPAKVYYILNTPIEEPINLPKIPTFEDTTIIEVNTEVPPSNIDISYKSKREV